MKKTFSLVLIMILGLSSFLYSTNKDSFGINGGLAIPIGELAECVEPGFQFGGVARIATRSPSLMVAFGANYAIFSGKKEHFRVYNSLKILNIFVGPQFGKEKGVYFLPAITGNFEEDWALFGIDIGAGALLLNSETGKTKLDLSVKFSLINPLGEGGSISIFRILAGLTFQ